MGQKRTKKKKLTHPAVLGILRVHHPCNTFPSICFVAVADRSDGSQVMHALSDGRRCCWLRRSDGGTLTWWMWINGLDLGLTLERIGLVDESNLATL